MGVSASFHSVVLLMLGEISSCAHWVRGWLASRSILDNEEESILARVRTQTPVHRCLSLSNGVLEFLATTFPARSLLNLWIPSQKLSALIDHQGTTGSNLNFWIIPNKKNANSRKLCEVSIKTYSIQKTHFPCSNYNETEVKMNLSFSVLLSSICSNEGPI
jgi:hypothetical protein